MRIWIDIREACRPRKTGKGQWTVRCVGALLLRSDVEVTVLSDRAVPDAWRSLPGFADVRILPHTGLRWHIAAWRLLLWERAAIDVFVSPTSFIVPFLLGGRLPTVPVVHDLIAFRNEPHDRKATFIERCTLPRTLRTARAVCTVSHATADLIRTQFHPSCPIVTVGAGPTIDQLEAWTGTGDHILCIGTLCPRKNQLRLIDAYAALPDSLRRTTRLVLIGGRGWSDHAIVERARTTPGVTWMGYVPEADCRQMLATCSVCACVSEEEGFGLPVLDALTCGAPVLASNIPSLREVAGDAATYVDPRSTASIAQGLAHMLTQAESAKQTHRTMRAALFSWEITAAHVRDACALAVDNEK